MGASSWPSAAELSAAKKKVAEMSGRDVADVRVVISPYRICPLGAHIDHQGGTVLAMTVNKGIILAFVPSCDRQVILRSGQFAGDVKFRVDEEQLPRSSMPVKEKDSGWGCYARGALYALQKTGKKLNEGIIGFISGSDGLDSSGLSSSAAVGIAYLMALESANNLCVSPSENIELDKLIENAYLGLRNGILDQSAILLSKYGYLTLMDCKTKEHTFVSSSMLNGTKSSERANKYKILLAFSGAKHCLKDNPGYNCRVKAWASGNLVEFGKLISASGLSSIQNYECGCDPMIQLYEILLRTPGVFGARFSGAGFRGCCLAFVDANQGEAATAFVQREYSKTQPELARQVPGGRVALLCEAGDSARVI
ncbi:hypothetical protein KFK09_028530 [Dendrobium nobile]|uniref:Galacturonokinase n=1 Tax=Dendrobium nobile TaxID=94219 RepID=A0A8T3A3C4_DENNO|nr:hypothetical protein KFK09_028530 [Dendrobium nobile]